MTRTDINNYQKASVERTNPQNAWVTLAAAPRRSYYGSFAADRPQRTCFERRIRQRARLCFRPFGFVF